MKRPTKIEFVGIHFKEGKEALDSTTKSGKIIDRVIENFKDFECSKSNLFPTTVLPKKSAREQYVDAFKVEEGTLYVCLGNIVRDCLMDRILLCVDMPHPGSIPWTCGGSEDYYVERSTRVVKAFFAGFDHGGQNLTNHFKIKSAQ